MTNRVKDDPLFIAAFDYLGLKTGAQKVEITFDQREPPVWTAFADYGRHLQEAAAALDPISAILRLCIQVVDGGICLTCYKATLFDPDLERQAHEGLCTIGWDPESGEFRSDCEMLQ